jgi:Rrf2 family iron-sulfur cluster assembly transcriptional regulator
MMISTRGRYALRVMVDLAEHQQGERYIPLKDIAKRQGISEKYLESILKLLVRDGLLVGLRGKGGGYRLTRPPESYTVANILRPTEGSLAPVACLESNAIQCNRTSMCPTLPMWKDLSTRINNFFESITIADLLEGEPLPCPAPKEQELFV